MDAHLLIRRARTEASLTQEQLARRIGVSQAALARLERPGANPTMRTLDRVVAATGRRLELRLAQPERDVDETLLREALRMAPAQRLAAAERLNADAAELAAAGSLARARA